VITLALLGAAAMVIGNALRESRASGGPARPPEERVVAANLLTVVSADISPLITAYGKVEARRTLDLRLPQGGTVVWISAVSRSCSAVVALSSASWVWVRVVVTLLWIICAV
jgi:multidrug efflux pump subunit AcrA (membrane-fusion protein)